MYNPALQQESRYEPASVIPLKQESSLLDWLKANNRLIPREAVEHINEVDDHGEFEDLIGTDDSDYDEIDYDDDDDVVEDLEA